MPTLSARGGSGVPGFGFTRKIVPIVQPPPPPPAEVHVFFKAEADSDGVPAFWENPENWYKDALGTDPVDANFNPFAYDSATLLSHVMISLENWYGGAFPMDKLDLNGYSITFTAHDTTSDFSDPSNYTCDPAKRVDLGGKFVPVPRPLMGDLEADAVYAFGHIEFENYPVD